MRVRKDSRSAWQVLNKFVSITVLLIGSMLLLAPGALAVDWGEYEFEWGEGLHREEWYDPTDWFDKGGGISYETDWYDQIYGYSDPYDYFEELETQGYFEQSVETGDFDFGLGYDYYTEDWHDSQGTFEKWY